MNVAGWLLVILVVGCLLGWLAAGGLGVYTCRRQQAQSTQEQEPELVGILVQQNQDTPQ